MENEKDLEFARKNRLESKIKTAEDLPVFSERQLAAFNSDYVDSLDEALAVLDETNKTPDIDNLTL